MEMWQIFDDAFAVELASGSLYANKVATAAMSSIANRAHEKRRAHDLGCKRLCSMGLLLCCCRPQEFVLVSSHNTTSPRVCLNVRDLVNCQPFVMSRSVHCSLYMLRMRKRATHGHTMRKRSSSKPHQLLFGNFYRSLRSHSLALAEKKNTRQGGLKMDSFYKAKERDVWLLENKAHNCNIILCHLKKG